MNLFFYTGLDAPPPKKVVDKLIKEYRDAKNFGSILTPPEIDDLNLVKAALSTYKSQSHLGWA